MNTILRLSIFLLLAITFSAQAASNYTPTESGLMSLKSAHSVAQTMDKLEHVLTAKGMTIFARINHAEGAKSVGQSLRPTELLVFGNPKVGSPLMRCQQTIALDLPQKALAWEDEKGQVWLSYNAPKYLAKRHQLKGCEEVLAKVENALNNFARAATK